MTKTFFLLLLLRLTAFPQTKPEPLDGPNPPLQDDLLDDLQGQWTLKGMIAGHPGDAQLDAAWVLNISF